MKTKAGRLRDARSIPLNPFEEQKRKLEEKKKREAEEEAAIYASFVSSFDDDGPSTGRCFVRAGEKRAPAAPTAPSLQSMFDPSAAPSAPKKKKTKNIDLFLEELKREAEHDKTENPPRAPSYPSQVVRGSYAGDGDMQSTNLYVGNLAPTVNESKLLIEFGKFGPIGSVKVMWPRSSEEMSRTASKCGFVSFMRREDAADALRELQGFEMDGQPLRMNWGKAVPTPAEPLPMPAGAFKPGVGSSPNLDLTYSVSKEQCKIVVTTPASRALKGKIDLTAQFTAKYGVLFERALMDDQPDWEFLFDRSSPEHIYYRWRVYALSQGDSMTNWRTSPFSITCHGPLWVAPPLPGSEAAAVGAKNRSGLPDPAKDKLIDLLHGLTTDRRKICYAMGFAMDNADFSAEIVAEIDTYFQKGVTTDVVPKVIALLYLVSDILHNSSSATVRNAWNFRNQLQTHLSSIFERLHQVYISIDGRLSAENMKEKVVRVLRVWRSWSVYPSEFVTELEYKFSGRQDQKTADNTVAPTDDDIDGQALSDEDIDGVPLF